MEARKHAVGLAILILAALPVFGAEKALYQKLAEQYAPVLYQEARSFKLDQVTRFDFDGDWNGANNWANAYLFPTPGYVYYAVIEADRHFFLYYSFFHSRDYTTRILESYAPKIEHENDMEGMMLVIPKFVEKNPQPIYMETLAHDRFYKYVAEGRTVPITARLGKIDGYITWDSDARSAVKSWHPAIFIESEGHGVFDLKHRYSDAAEKFPGFVYRFARRGAEEPEEMGDMDISYALLPISEQLWNRRMEIGRNKTYCCAERFDLKGNRSGRWGASFNGPIGGCAAKPPWGWDQRDDGTVAMGAWFLHPIAALEAHANIPDFSREYVDNPFYEGPADSSEAQGCQDSPASASRSVPQSAVETVLGIGQVLLSGGLKQKNVGDKARGMFMKNMEFLEWSFQPEMARWQFADAASKPIFEARAEEGRVYRTRLEISGTALLNSPPFSAPGRFYKELVIRYRIDQPMSFQLSWQYSGQTTFPGDQLTGAQELSPAAEWKILRIPLESLKNWQATQEIGRIQLQCKAVRQPVFLELQYIVLDRVPLSETFRKEQP